MPRGVTMDLRFCIQDTCSLLQACLVEIESTQRPIICSEVVGDGLVEKKTLWILGASASLHFTGFRMMTEERGLTKSGGGLVVRPVTFRSHMIWRQYPVHFYPCLFTSWQIAGAAGLTSPKSHELRHIARLRRAEHGRTARAV